MSAFMTEKDYWLTQCFWLFYSVINDGYCEIFYSEVKGLYIIKNTFFCISGLLKVQITRLLSKVKIIKLQDLLLLMYIWRWYMV